MNDMAGLEDYRYYALLEKDSPFWERRQADDKQQQAKVPMEENFGREKLSRPHKLDFQDNSPSPPSRSLEELALSVQKAKKQERISYDSLNTPDKIPWLQTAETCIESVISHPWIVLRRQCQVYGGSRRYHIFSPTLIPVMVTLSRCQGVGCMFKGVGSTLLLKGTMLWVEDLVSKLTPWPKSFKSCHSLRGLGQHMLLKCVSVLVITPFYSASLVETVQSNIASETPGPLDVFKEGIVRMLSWATPQTGRLLPVWALVVPTVLYSVSHYTLSSFIQTVLNKILALLDKEKYHRRGALPKEEDVFDNFFRQQNVRLTSSVIADLVFYPFETVLNRLHLQGTRTIVDNLDTGTSVVPILNQYEGMIDCWKTIKMEEGPMGAWKGVGSVVLQYIVLFSLLRLGNLMLNEVRYGSSKKLKSSELQKKSLKT